jgi:hypothetical protein
MEPLNDPEGIEAASRAAKKTVRSTQDKPMEEEEESGYFQNAVECFMDTIAWPAEFFRSTMLPWYHMQRLNAKLQVTKLLYGDAPFACKVRVTGINLLVFCSFVFLLLEVVNLAFFPATFDKEVAIVGA